ncbi:MAG: peptidase domain-containing ABC transporter, partial [Deltaproteobacteria bacterium]|nr:peptidase domain-containing ABC transporter [Deltaproteobacteria bacterium]
GRSPDLPPLGFSLLLKAEAGRVTYLIPGEQAPRDDDIATFATTYVGSVLQFARQEAPLTDPDQADKESRFGFRWFLPELLKHKTLWRDVLLASLAIQLVGLATPLFTQVIIDKVVVHQTKSTLVVLGIALVMFMLFTSTMTWLRQYLVLHTGNRIDAVLGSQVFRHLLRLPLPYFELRPTGTLVARLHGVETIREFVSSAAVTLILDFPFLLIFLAVMFWYSWQLSLIAVGLLGLICLMSLLVAPIFRERLNQQFLLGARNQSFLTEYVSGMATVKSLQMEPHVEKRYGDYLASYLAAGFGTKQVGNTYNVVANGVEQVMTLSILVVGALLVMQNDGFTVGMLVAFQMFAGRMSQPMLRLVGLWQEFQQADVAVKRLGDILDMPTEPHTLTPAREAGGKGLIELVDVAFRYSEHHPWLYRNLNIRFKPGHLTVLMGPSGCGKSTLAKLLQGFYQPSDGLIRLDGRDIRHLAANELRATFGVVPQETVLFSGTLYDNLVMAQPHASFEDVIRACKAAEIHEVIDQLPQGYQTEIGERGTGLSGGQRQRLAIARALLKRPKVLVFDEAVSNLDQQTAEHFARTINTLKGKVTMIFITHQIPRGLQVDEVITLGEHSTRMSVAGEQDG